MSGNEFLPNFVEHIVPYEEKKKTLPKKAAIVGLAIFLFLLIFVLASTVFQMFAALVPVLYILVAFLIWYLWRFVSIEFEYTILQGEISFDIVYGRRQRKQFYSTPISRIEKIGTVEEMQPRLAGAREVFCASTRSNPNTRVALVREEGGGTVALYFEITQKAEKVLRFHSARAFLK